MNLLSKILNLLGFNPSMHESKLSKMLESDIANEIERLKNRVIHKELTIDIIDSYSDEDLLWVVFDNLSQNHANDSENEYETVMSWNKAKQAIYMIWELEMEVNNGGFNQFYFNSSGKFYKHLPDALILVGANKYANLCKQANETFEKENPKITQHQDGTIEGFSKSYENNPLNKFDDEFYDLYESEDLEQLQVDFIRKNKMEFIG